MESSLEDIIYHKVEGDVVNYYNHYEQVVFSHTIADAKMLERYLMRDYRIRMETIAQQLRGEAGLLERGVVGEFKTI